MNKKSSKEASKSLVNNEATEDAVKPTKEDSKPTKETIDNITSTTSEEPNITSLKDNTKEIENTSCDKPNITNDDICDTNAEILSPTESDQIKPADVKSSGNSESVIKAASIKSGSGNSGTLESLIQAASIKSTRDGKSGNLESLIKAASKDQLNAISGNLESLIKAASINSGDGKSGDNKKDKGNSRSGETSAKSESLSCEKCGNKFPSKNKLFTHLKSTGHAIYVPKGALLLLWLIYCTLN